MIRTHGGKFFGSKNDKMESKFQVNMGTVCWICHQDSLDRFNDEAKKIQSGHPIFSLFKKIFNPSKPAGKLYSDQEGEKFSPCLCKGSLGKVHRYCLNKWVLQQYQNEFNNFKIHEAEEYMTIDNQENYNLFCIKCPNCKYPYKYRSYEIKKLNLKNINLFTKEKIILFLLLNLQIIFLFADLKYNFFEDKTTPSIPEENSISKGGKIQDMSDLFHIFTVFIIICAAGFNVIEIFVKKTKIEVLDMI
jgi:hypothetical protein